MPFKDPFPDNFCQCVEGPYPEWFKIYMKKFKKELKDLRSNISEIIHEEFEKEKQLAEIKLFKPLNDKNESSSPTKLKKKKKISDRDIDMFERREMKLLKKIDKLHSDKFDKLMYPVLGQEKLESKKSSSLEERRPILERVYKNKTRDAKKTLEPEKKCMRNAKFTIASESSVFLILQPGAEFSFFVNVLNNGRVPWVSPRMQCFSTPDIFIREQLIILPRMEPNQSAHVPIQGKVTQNLGHYCFTYKLYDGLEEFGPLFVCFAVVSDSTKKIFPNSEKLKLNSKATLAGKFVGTLIDSENATIASSQKKIKENITEIERTLQDIDLLRQCTSSNKSREERLLDNPEECQVGDFDPMDDNETKFWKERPEEELICGAAFFEQMAKTEKSGIVENENFQTKKNVAESDSDSELSVVFTSEDENFIFVHLSPESSNSETPTNTTKPSKLDMNNEFKEVNQKPKKGIIEERSEKIPPKEVGYKEISAAKSCLCGRFLTEKPNPAFQYIPTSANIRPFSVISDGCYKSNIPPRMFGRTFSPPCCKAFIEGLNGRPIDRSMEETSLSRNMEIGEKRNHNQSAPDHVFYDTREYCPFNCAKSRIAGNRGHWSNFVPKYDCLGKPIYAVRCDGYCLPIKDLIQNKERASDVVGMMDSEKETQKELKTQMNENHKASEDASKTITQNGMISVASKAFSTAKCVINNIHSAFKQEMGNKPCDIENNFLDNLYSMGEEERRYVEKLEDKEKYIGAMLALHEMGFVNTDLNFRLLKKHDCELLEVITEIVDMPVEEA